MYKRKYTSASSATAVKRQYVAPRTKYVATRTKAPAVLITRPGETKGVDTPLTVNAISTTAIFTLLNPTLQGTALQNRIGRKISLKSVGIRGFIRQYQGGAAASFDYLRCMLVYDRQPNGAAPVIADLLLDVDSTGAATTTSLSGLNLANADRFKIIRDMYWKVDDTDGNVVGAQPACVTTDFTRFAFKEYAKLNNMETHCNGGNAGTIADINTGALWFVTLGLAAGANSQYSAEFTARVRYTDA